MNGPAGNVVRDIQRRIDDANDQVSKLRAEYAELAFDALRGVPEAIARMVEVREQDKAAGTLVDDLTAALTPALKLASAEQDTADKNAHRTQHKRAVMIAEMRLRAAHRVDELVAELSAAMVIHDQMANLAHAMTARSVGEAASRVTTGPCVNVVLGQLVRNQAIPREHLPGDHLGELSNVRHVTESARRHLAILATHAPAATVTTVAA